MVYFEVVICVLKGELKSKHDLNALIRRLYSSTTKTLRIRYYGITIKLKIVIHWLESVYNVHSSSYFPGRNRF